MEDEKIEVNKKQWIALTIAMVGMLMEQRLDKDRLPVYRISKEHFKEWGKWILDNHIHLVYLHDEDNIMLAIQQLESIENVFN